jgi:hypothetical protein
MKIATEKRRPIAIGGPILLGSSKASLALSTFPEQKYQNGNFHRKLRVPTSEREGKPLNPCACAGRAMHGENLTEIYGNQRAAPRAPCIDFAAAKNTVQ